MTKPIEVIDSHIHLFPASELSELAWCKEGNPLASQHSIAEYRNACHPDSSSRFINRGFVFLETDRISSSTEWKYPLQEVDWLNRVSTGNPRDGEGHTEEDKQLVLGIVPWAPLPVGKEKLEEYFGMINERCEKGKLKGFRYLVQDKPKGTMLEAGFIDGLKHLGREGYSFDLGVDFRQGGPWQLQEAVEMIRRAHEGVEDGEKVLFVISEFRSFIYRHYIQWMLHSDGDSCIDHMCKPNMRRDSENVEEDFEKWKSLIIQLAHFKSTYMKISGGFSEIEPLPSSVEQNADDKAHRLGKLKELVPHIGRYIDVAWSAFGAQRCIWASDWPVCNIGGGGNRLAWRNWLWIVESWAEEQNLDEDQTKALFGRNAAQVYRISEYDDGRASRIWAEG